MSTDRTHPFPPPNPFIKIVAGFALMGLCFSARAQTHVSFESAVASPAFSAADSLQGLVPEVVREGGDGRVYISRSDGLKSPSSLTDATDGNHPTEDLFFYHSPTNASAYNLIFDLGSAVPARSRQLNKFSIWVSNHDVNRNHIVASLAVSSDGTNWTQIPGAECNKQGIRPKPNTYNHVSFTFAPKDVTGFRYIRLNVASSNRGHCSRFIELDAEVETLR